MVAAKAAVTGETVNIRDAYNAPDFDFSGTQAFDETTGYRSKSFLTVPLRNHEDEVIGVLQLINAVNRDEDRLTPQEREIINYYIVATIKMLESLPYPKNLRRVPEFACGHHEKMDGSGYPRGLTREEMSVQARVMGIADIF